MSVFGRFRISKIDEEYRFMTRFIIPILVLLEIADGILTYVAVGGKIVQEANPIWQSTAGDIDFLLIKITGAIISALLLWQLYRRFPTVSYLTSAIIMLFYTAVYTWNISVIIG